MKASVRSTEPSMRMRPSTSSGVTSTWHISTSTLSNVASSEMRSYQVSLLRFQDNLQCKSCKSSMRTSTSLVWSTSTGATLSTKPCNLQDRSDRNLRDRPLLQSKSTIIKKRYALRYLAGQERMCRISGMAQRITPQLLNLQSKDQDTHRVLKVALQTVACASRHRSTAGLHDEVQGRWHLLPSRSCLSQETTTSIETRRKAPTGSYSISLVATHNRGCSCTRMWSADVLAATAKDACHRWIQSSLRGHRQLCWQQHCPPCQKENRQSLWRAGSPSLEVKIGYQDAIDGDYSDFVEADGAHRHWSRCCLCIIAVWSGRLLISSQPMRHLSSRPVLKSRDRNESSAFHWMHRGLKRMQFGFDNVPRRSPMQSHSAHSMSSFFGTS